MFKREDIKAGYLLRCTHLKEGRQFNMTVAPCLRSSAPMFWLGDMAATKDGDLACCNKGMDWLPLSGFDNNLVHANTYRVDEVWGYASPMRLMDNTTEGRERLWQRDETKRMTLEEIETALGHKVKIVQAGEPVPGPSRFKKSSLCAGQVVQLRKGEKRVVVPTESGLVLANGCGKAVTFYNQLKEYRDDLTHIKTAAKDLDIMKVWSRTVSLNNLANTFTATDEGRKLLWERDETKRMTLEEIAKVLGYKVEVVQKVQGKEVKTFKI